ncbi:hypothetical protein C5N14_01610 [Micromonospora sp. MW-13]|uniref:hypothetical protein n=1 Tax=unclassified Micromonospora TaxID=2617518 RepID=UPI000E436C94|nr:MULTISPECIES: hypothetical protein [unclassified Micromonospora]MCX4469889.1 hypothetical protein [Micromonospora sp. NBC_01655]RGC70817.1 hypothetical protein C5N14_01610 [Micromonospora sp. MW-13]
MADPSRPPPYRPGAVSLFFVAKAGVFAAGFWIWLLVLVLDTDQANGAHVLAAAGAVTTTLVGVVLGARLALQRNAAVRHAELKRLLVDISWNAFAAAGNAETPGKVVPFPTVSSDGERSGRGAGDRVSMFDRGSTNERAPGRDRGGNGERRR